MFPSKLLVPATTYKDFILSFYDLFQSCQMIFKLGVSNATYT